MSYVPRQQQNEWWPRGAGVHIWIVDEEEEEEEGCEDIYRSDKTGVRLVSFPSVIDELVHFNTSIKRPHDHVTY